MIFTTLKSQNTIPNPSFENWTQYSNYTNPNSWSTPNATTASLNIHTVTKESSIKQSGQFSAKIQSKSIFGTPIPGLITLGEFSVNLATMQATISGGVEFTARPNSLKGYFQYEPVSNDEAFIGILMLKKTGNIWDTIGTGQFKTSNRIVTWTEFIANITYTSNDNPTHMNIIIVSSDINLPQPNSTLYIDNLSLTFPQNINNSNYEDFKVIYSDNEIEIYNPASHTVDYVEVYSIDGKLVKKLVANSNSKKIKINNLNLKSGIYIFKTQLNSTININRKITVL